MSIKVMVHPKPAKRHRAAVIEAECFVSIRCPSVLNPADTGGVGLHLCLHLPGGATQRVIIPPGALAELERDIKVARAGLEP